MNLSLIKNRLTSSWFALAIISLTAAIIYSNIYSCPFIFDDAPQIVKKSKIRYLNNYLSIEQLLKPRAIVDLTFALNYKFGKLNVFGYHLVNVLIHIINGFIVYFLALMIFKQLSAPPIPQSLNPSIPESSIHPFIHSSIHPFIQPSIRLMSLFAALIFIAHPIQTQSVTYTVQRYASMAAMFYMASVLFYLKARIEAQSSKQKAQSMKLKGESRKLKAESSKLKAQNIKQKAESKNDEGRRPVLLSLSFELSALYSLSIFCGMLAFLSKQNTASLPGAILLVEYLLVDRTWQRWKRKIPWFAVAFTLWFFFVLHVSGFFAGEHEGAGVFEDVSKLMQETDTVSRWSYLCTQFNVLVIYIRLLFLPIGQNLDYMYPFKTGFFDAYTPLAFLFLMGVVGIGIWNIKKRPIITFAIFWFFTALAVESSIIPIRDALFEHRLYLAMFSFAIVVACLVFYFLSNKRSWAIAVIGMLVLSLGTATYLRNNTWRDRITFWSDVVSKTPHNYRAQNNLGEEFDEKGRIEEAIGQYFKALKIKPDYACAHNRIGLVRAHQGNIKDAIYHYSEALRINPEFADVYNNFGIVLRQQGRLDDAIRQYFKALKIKPDYAEVYNNLGIALAQQGKLKEAAGYYTQALQINPDMADAHHNLGSALYQEGRLKEAIAHFLDALRIMPDFAEAYNSLGAALYAKRKYSEAAEHFSEALRLKPGFTEAKNNLKHALNAQK